MLFHFLTILCIWILVTALQDFFLGGVINSLGNLPQEDKISNKSLVCCKLSILANKDLLPVGGGGPRWL